ncbi:tetratricopeptide repeat protein [bacterium]|nr:tetratricopeptide repeat protein [bacterium]
MALPLKDWLVRTRAGDVLGPYSQRELMDELKKSTFSLEDEIAPAQGHWISAQALSYHDTEELTSTSTRTQQPFTSSLSNVSPAGPSELTPTPEARVNIKPGAGNQSQVRIPAHLLPKSSQSGFRPLAWLGVLAVGVLSVLIYSKLTAPHVDEPATQVTSASSGASSESPFVRQIYNLIQAGKSQVALRQLTLYHERGPSKTDVEYLIPYAALLIQEGESPSRAKKFLDLVLESDGSAYLKSRAQLWLGYMQLAAGKPDQAESHFLEALELTPKDAAARFNLGRTYLKQERYALALDYLALAELEAPDLWLVQIYKGRAKLALELPVEAQTAFKAAIENAPDRWITYIYYALFLAQTNQYAEAQKTLKKMLTRDPHFEIHSPAPFGFYQEKVNYAEYLSAFTHVMERTPGEEREVGKRFIQYLMNGGDEGTRIEAMADKGSLTPRVFALKVVLDRESTASQLKKAITRLPESLDAFGYYAYVLRGEAQARLGLYEESKKDFQRAIELSPQSAISRWAYASLLQKVQQMPLAHGQIRELLRYNPGYVPAIVWTQNL